MKHHPDECEHGGQERTRKRASAVGTGQVGITKSGIFSLSQMYYIQGKLNLQTLPSSNAYLSFPFCWFVKKITMLGEKCFYLC